MTFMEECPIPQHPRAMAGTAPLGPGEALLATVIASRWDGEQLARIPLRLQYCTPAQWRQALAWHGLAGVVIKKHADALHCLPPAYRDAARELHTAHAPRALRQLQALTEASSALTAAGVLHVPLKGLFLSQALYGDIGVRQSADVDMLIDPAQFNQAFTALSEAGFISQFGQPQGPKEAAMLLRGDHHMVWLSPSGQCVELHWRNEPSMARSLPPLGRLRDELQNGSVGTLNIQVLSRQLLSQAVAEHAARGGGSWKWGYDVLELVCQASGVPPWCEDAQRTRTEHLVLAIMARKLGIAAYKAPPFIRHQTPVFIAYSKAFQCRALCKRGAIKPGKAQVLLLAIRLKCLHYSTRMMLETGWRNRFQMHARYFSMDHAPAHDRLFSLTSKYPLFAIASRAVRLARRILATSLQ